MIWLVVLCVIGQGETWSPPQGWSVERVAIEGQKSNCQGSICYSVYSPKIAQSSVTIRKAIVSGEQAEVPQGCSSVAVKSDAKK